MLNSLITEYKSKHGTVTLSGYLNYLLSFVQNIPYQSDEDYLNLTEYWKFPLETIFDKGGDCEDIAILFATLALESKERLSLDFDIALQILPGHLCAAVKSSSLSGDTNPQGYIYGETTAKNYSIGTIPDKMKDYFVKPDYYPKKSFTVQL